MIRHYNGKNGEEIVMQSKRGAIWVIVWGRMNFGFDAQGHRVCLTLGECEKARENWARWQIRKGLSPTRHPMMPGLFVFPPGERALYCQIQKGDPQTRRRLDIR